MRGHPTAVGDWWYCLQIACTAAGFKTPLLRTGVALRTTQAPKAALRDSTLPSFTRTQSEILRCA
jgi:hypothetical protein